MRCLLLTSNKRGNQGWSVLQWRQPGCFLLRGGSCFASRLDFWFQGGPTNEYREPLFASTLRNIRATYCSLCIYMHISVQKFSQQVLWVEIQQRLQQHPAIFQNFQNSTRSGHAWSYPGHMLFFFFFNNSVTCNSTHICDDSDYLKNRYGYFMEMMNHFRDDL